jgi:hypothetical protein
MKTASLKLFLPSDIRPLNEPLNSPMQTSSGILLSPSITLQNEIKGECGIPARILGKVTY